MQDTDEWNNKHLCKISALLEHHLTKQISDLELIVVQQ